MKIAFVISFLSAAGGMERRMLTFTNRWAAKGWDISIITIGSSESYYPLHPKIKVYPLNLQISSNNILQAVSNNIKRFTRLRNNLKKIEPDVIISFMTSTNILSILVAKSLKLPIICSEGDVYHWQRPNIWKILRRLVYPRGDKIITLTKEDMKNYSWIKSKNFINNPVNEVTINNDFAPILKRPKIILGLGRLDSNKAYDIVIKAYAKIKDKRGYKLNIIGDGQDKNRFERLIKNLKQESNIKLLGKKKNVAEFYNNSRIFVLSSKIEAFGNVLIEAMANGCACLATDCDYGPREIITNNYNGLLTQVDNIDMMSKNLEKLINDEQLQQKLSEQALKAREKYSIEKISKQWEHAIKEVLKQKSI